MYIVRSTVLCVPNAGFNESSRVSFRATATSRVDHFADVAGRSTASRTGIHRARTAFPDCGAFAVFRLEKRMRDLAGALLEEEAPDMRGFPSGASKTAPPPHLAFL
jgi:hypothetical protein